MPSRRKQCAMSGEELWAFIDTQVKTQCATLNLDGSAHLTTLWFARENDVIILESFTRAQKVVNLERDPRITLLFEDGHLYGELRGASIKGTAELVRGDASDADFQRVFDCHMKVVLRNNFENVDAKVLEQGVRAMAAKKTTILVRPERHISWDHSKLGGIY